MSKRSFFETPGQIKLRRHRHHAILLLNSERLSCTSEENILIDPGREIDNLFE